MKPDAAFKGKLAMLRQGHHACFFYDDAETARKVTTAFLQIGLEHNEKGLYLADPLSVAQVRESLAEAGIDVAREAARGSLVLTSERAHLVDGRFDADNMLKTLEDAVRGALSGGFRGLRATGDVVWELGSDVDMHKLVEYEHRLEDFFAGKKLAGLCQYNRNVISEEQLRRSIESHNAVVRDEEVAFCNRQI